MDRQRLTRFERALQGCVTLLQARPDSAPLRSVIEQLLYLIALETGQVTDRSFLERLNIGSIAAREVEDLDMPLAMALHEVSAEVRRMRQGA